MPNEKEPGAGFIVTGEIRDEFLESLWLLEETGGGKKTDKQSVFAIAVQEGYIEDNAGAETVITDMAARGDILLDGDYVSLSDAGREAARNIIRRKRLAETLLSEVFALGPMEMKNAACQFEHILSPEVTDSVCSFLGHPPSCPHGKPIPRGNCCKKLAHHIRPLVMPMKELEPGNRARITFISPRDHGRMDRLSTLGIVPGTDIILHQKKPAFVIRAGETELALDLDIAAEIYVKLIS